MALCGFDTQIKLRYKGMWLVKKISLLASKKILFSIDSLLILSVHTVTTE